MHNTLWEYSFKFLRASVRNASSREAYPREILRRFMLPFLQIVKSLLVFLLSGCFVPSTGNQLSAQCGGEEREVDDLDEGEEGEDRRGCSIGI